MKTTLGIEFELFFPQISHRAKIGCAKYDLSTGEGVAMEQWYLNMGEVPGTPLGPDSRHIFQCQARRP